MTGPSPTRGAQTRAPRTPRVPETPGRPPSTVARRGRFDDGSCGVPGCPCDHDPHSTLGSCDHGFTSDDGAGRARRCRRCAEHAQARAQARREARQHG